MVLIIIRYVYYFPCGLILMAIIFLINKRIENIENLVSMKTQQILHDRLCMSLFCCCCSQIFLQQTQFHLSLHSALLSISLLPKLILCSRVSSLELRHLAGLSLVVECYIFLNVVVNLL